MDPVFLGVKQVTVTMVKTTTSNFNFTRSFCRRLCSPAVDEAFANRWALELAEHQQLQRIIVES